MKEFFASFFTGLTFNQVVIVFMAIVFSVVLLLVTIGFVLDRLNIKSFSFKTGFTFYQDGDVKRSRITRRKKTVSKK